MNTATVKGDINSPKGRYVRVIFNDGNMKYAKIFSQGMDVKIILNVENSFTDDISVLQKEIEDAFARSIKLSIQEERDSEGRIDKYVLEMREGGKLNFGEFLDRMSSSLRIGELLLYFIPKK